MRLPTILTLRPCPAAAAALAVLTGIVAAGCGDRAAPPEAVRSARPSILLVTLDTTRADAIGPEAQGVRTPAFNALAARGRRFRQAYATVPETLPSHASMLTGLYPAGHGVHENARPLPAAHATAAERLRQDGYRTAAYVSSFVLARRFGLARGFETYDDELPDGTAERDAATTTDRAIAFLSASPQAPIFLWVHYFDPHAPYTPSEAFRDAYRDKPYLGEVAAMDAQLGRLVEAFERQAPGPHAIAVTSDHGEGLGDHGELLHGSLLYQSTMQVPLVLVGPGVAPGLSDTPASTRRIFHTLLDWAGLGAADSLRGETAEVVLGEAMKPFLEYGWQPQTMAVEGTSKAILAGTLETYDLAADPHEQRNLGAGAPLPSSLRRALEDYPVPSLQETRTPANLDEDARRRLASLGYIGASTPPVVRPGAPRPADMVHIFGLIDRASSLFVEQRYTEAIPVLERILGQDPQNLDATLRLATALSSLGRDQQAVAAFRKAAQLAPQSQDVQMYTALHYARGAEWERAVPVLERLAAATPARLPALEALARIRERQGRTTDAIAFYRQIHEQRAATAAELVRVGGLAMQAGQTDVAIGAFEQARARSTPPFAHDLELGVLYLAARRLPEARAALDRVPRSHPEYAMALFKRAQVSVLLNEPDREARIEAARKGADATTRALIASERLFQPAAPR